MYTIRLRLIGKHVVDFLFMLIERFSLAVMAEALRVKIDRKSALCKGGESVLAKFSVIFGQIVRPVNALQLCRHG